MKYLKEFGYGAGILLLHVLFGVVSGYLILFLVSGTTLSALTIYVLCKLK